MSRFRTPFHTAPINLSATGTIRLGRGVVSYSVGEGGLSPPQLGLESPPPNLCEEVDQIRGEIRIFKVLMVL